VLSPERHEIVFEDVEKLQKSTFVILSVAKNPGGTGILPVQLLNRLEACSTTFFTSPVPKSLLCLGKKRFFNSL